MKRAVFGLGSAGLLWLLGCSAGADPGETGPGSGSGSSTENGSGGGGGEGASCPRCDGTVYTECNGDSTDCADQDFVCTRDLGCALCAPGSTRCVDDGTVEVEECNEDGTGYDVVETCGEGLTCFNGRCRTACEAAEDQPSNVGCEFWAVDLDQQDGGGNDPASEPWGLALSNVGDQPATVSIEMNTAPPGAPAEIMTSLSITVPPGTLEQVTLPTRELDCGARPNDYASPGTCLSSNAFRVRSNVPIVVTQFNVFENSYSNDASLLIPTSTLGQTYRVVGWNAGHPAEVPFFEGMIDRSYITVVGTADGTNVRVRPSWKIKGNPPIAATPAGTDIEVTLNAFDVLNLETDDGTLQDDPMTVADLSGSAVYADKPVAVFSGVESTSVPYAVEIPTYPGWDDGKGGGGETCCLDHLEEQLFPVESAGTNYVITRSPLRSSGWRDPDVIRFVGAAEAATITTTLPAPFNSFTLQPGEVRTTWTQDNFTATADKPFLLAQYTISQGYTTSALGDPDFTVFPPAEQQRSEYIILTPGSWTQNWVVIAAEVGTSVTIDGAAPSGCLVESAGTVLGVTYESRTCPLEEGKHALSGDKPFQIIAYGYGSAGSYAFVGGADVKKIYEPPPPPN